MAQAYIRSSSLGAMERCVLFAILLATVRTVAASVSGRIKYRKNPDYCLDSGENPGNGSPVFLWACNELQQQYWFWRDDSTISVGITQKCLDLPGGDPATAPNLWLWDCNGQSQQQWGWATNSLFPDSEGGGILYPLNSGAWTYCVDTANGGSPYNGQALLPWACDEQSNDGILWLVGQQTGNSSADAGGVQV
uniref:Ricin B lectin domain-containing protein n=1 Tax=Noctiluca scintillans TaxID=2966 RepID=A0A7S1ASG7_NOCSC